MRSAVFAVGLSPGHTPHPSAGHGPGGSYQNYGAPPWRVEIVRVVRAPLARQSGQLSGRILYSRSYNCCSYYLWGCCGRLGGFWHLGASAEHPGLRYEATPCLGPLPAAEPKAGRRERGRIRSTLIRGHGTHPGSGCGDPRRGSRRHTSPDTAGPARSSRSARAQPRTRVVEGIF